MSTRIKRPGCDREVGSPEKGWHVCNRPAVLAEDRTYLLHGATRHSYYTRHLCARHAHLAGICDPESDIPFTRTLAIRWFGDTKGGTKHEQSLRP